MDNYNGITNPTVLNELLRNNRHLSPQEATDIRRAWFYNFVKNYQLPGSKVGESGVE